MHGVLGLEGHARSGHLVTDGAEDQRPIRVTARPWDTGGIFSIMLRSEDTQALYDAAIARGWWAESDARLETPG